MKDSSFKLSFVQRLIAVAIYLVVFLFACRSFSRSWEFLSLATSSYYLLFVSGSLLLILGSYLVEPFFTKPVDVVTNTTAITLTLIAIRNPEDFFAYYPILYGALCVLGLSIITIALTYFPKAEKIQRIMYKVITTVGKSRAAFSVIYLATLVSYFSDSKTEFAFFLTLWIIIITRIVVEELILWIAGIIRIARTDITKEGFLGTAIGCENPFLYKVEVDFFKHNVRDSKKGELVYLSIDNSMGAVGVIINEKQLLNKKWITVYLLEHNNSPLKISFKKNEFILGSKTIFSKDNAVYIFDLEILEDDQKETIANHFFYENREEFIGYVSHGSDIGKIKFHSLIGGEHKRFAELREGTVVQTKINSQEVLYQVIDGSTNEEELEKHSIYGFLTGTAQKLGKYDIQTKELDVVKWLPDIYSPIFFANINTNEDDKLSIGKLPGTDVQVVVKDADSLVTHNTAILGILGIGKSCLTFELVQKVIRNTDAKVICIDITNEYKKELIEYLPEKEIKSEISEAELKDLKQRNTDGNSDDPTTWGNEGLYKTKLDNTFKEFAEGESRVLILNPDWHSVSKAGSNFKITHKVDLTVAEKTRIISERIFIYAKKQWDESGEQGSKEAKFLLVFEEAHALIPEWNSASNSGDQNASNGTAKVILQGRKYGLGSFVVTQRTANISKSILNQCNTIFALRVFDDTGKQFLENYIGRDYSNTLPTLEERHAVIIGKSLKLKQPVIVRLNDKDSITIDPD